MALNYLRRRGSVPGSVRRSMSRAEKPKRADVLMCFSHSNTATISITNYLSLGFYYFVTSKLKVAIYKNHFSTLDAIDVRRMYNKTNRLLACPQYCKQENVPLVSSVLFFFIFNHDLAYNFNRPCYR